MLTHGQQPTSRGLESEFPVMVSGRGPLSFHYELLGPLLTPLVPYGVVSPFNVFAFRLTLTLVCLQFDLIFRLGNTMYIYCISLKLHKHQRAKSFHSAIYSVGK